MEFILIIIQFILIIIIQFIVFFLASLICGFFSNGLNIVGAIKMSIATIVVNIIYTIISFFIGGSFILQLLIFVPFGIIGFMKFFDFEATPAYLVGSLYFLFISLFSSIFYNFFR